MPTANLRRRIDCKSIAFAPPHFVIRPSTNSHSAFISSSNPPLRLPRRHIRQAKIQPRSQSNVSDTPESQENTPLPLNAQSTLSLRRISRSLWQFSRPHTIYGTLISVFSISFLAMHHHSLPLPQATAYFLTAVIPALLLNIYIVGLNQFYDVPIDRVNKPYLPLASGAMTSADAQFVITVALLSGLAFCIAPVATPALRTVLISSAALGTVYSAPPLRLKRFALLASMAILTVRGLLVNIGFFLHTGAASTTAPLSSLAVLPPVIAFAAVFFTLFGVVIALLKDVPDIKGDRMFGIRTFSVRVGAAAIFRACVVLLVSMFLSAGAFFFSIAPGHVGRVVTLILHTAMALLLAWRARSVDATDKSQVTDFYMLSWKAFYAEYLVLPLAVL